MFEGGMHYTYTIRFVERATHVYILCVCRYVTVHMYLCYNIRCVRGVLEEYPWFRCFSLLPNTFVSEWMESLTVLPVISIRFGDVWWLFTLNIHSPHNRTSLSVYNKCDEGTHLVVILLQEVNIFIL